MADLRMRGDDRSRGQLLLVAGFAIATAIVALVIILNASIYAENLATRDTDTGASEAIAFQTTVESNLWRVVDAENDRTYDDRGKLRANVSDRIDRLESQSARRHRSAGVAAALTNRTLNDGSRLVQDDSSRNLTSNTPTADWTLATGVDDVRKFELNSTGGLNSTTDPAADNAFAVDITGNGGSGDTWSLFLYNDTGTGNPTIAVKNDTSPPTDVCGGLFSDPPRVNLTAGTVEGSSCSQVDFESDTNGPDPPYDIEYRRGDLSTGTYSLTVNETVSAGGSGDDFNGPGPTTSPYVVPTVYSVSADVVYQSPRLTYRARINVTEGTA